ncbi:MATE family efflux transporter [Anoxybacillus sp. D401a]|uniref:MATE family efflux transporter n=1 Tax=Anoxybacillus sp. D401a TaxID=575112 RepID=UPI003D34AE11
MFKQFMSQGKTIVVLAFPIIIENFLQSVVGFVDTLFISQLGLHEVAAVGVSNTILNIYFAVFLAIATAATVMIARAIGAGDNEKMAVVITNSVYVTIVVGVVFGFLSFFFAEFLLQMMGASEAVLHIATTYFRIVAVPSVLIAIMFTLGAIFRGLGDTKTPMRVGMIMNVIHVALDYVLIFGVFFQGFGMVGAAVATVCARVIGVVLLWRQLVVNGPITWKKEVWGTDKHTLRTLIRLGLPASFERLFMRFGQVIYFGMIIRMGVEAYSAHTLAGNFTMFSTIIGTGLATATATIIGQHIGAKQMEAVRAYSRAAMIVLATTMTTVMFFLFVTSSTTAKIFTNHPTVLFLIVAVLGIDTLTQPATAVVTALTSVLQAGGDTKYPMYVTAIGIWAVRTLGVYVLGVYFSFGLIGAWIAIGVDNYVRAALLYWRYRSSQWVKAV